MFIYLGGGESFDIFAKGGRVAFIHHVHGESVTETQ